MGWSHRQDAAGRGIHRLPAERTQMVDKGPSWTWAIVVEQAHHALSLGCQCTHQERFSLHYTHSALLWKEKLSVYVAFLLWLCRRNNSYVTSINGTNSTAEPLMASNACKSCTNLLQLFWFGKMNRSVEDGHHFLHNIVDNPADSGSCHRKQLLPLPCRRPHRQASKWWPGA